MRARVLGGLAAFLPVFAALYGCSHPESAADRHAADMRETIDKIQEDQDKASQRLADDPGPTAAKKNAAQAKTGTPNRTVQIGDGDTESDDPNDPAARPEIRVAGPGGGSSRSSSRRSGSARIETSDDPSSSSKSGNDGKPSILDPEAKKAYEAALKLVHDKQYAKGVEALNAFMVKWPDHPYVENATYWRGEAFFSQGEFLKAAEQFEAVLARFGGGSKAPDALYKIGLCHERLGSSARAQEYWDRLKRDYPKSEAARKIPANDDRKTRGPKETR